MNEATEVSEIDEADIQFQAVVLAAGRGTRMKSSRAKVMHDVLGRPMIDHVIQAAIDAGAARVVAILGYQREEIEAHLREVFGDRVACVVQAEQLGTAHAVFSAREFLQGPEVTLVLSGDVPNMDAATLVEFFEASTRLDCSLAVMTARPEDPAHYGRIVRSQEGDVVGIVEWADAAPEVKRIAEINAGSYACNTELLLEGLTEICSNPPTNAQGEYYLTDMVQWAAASGYVVGWPLDDARKMQGVNTRVELAKATKFMQRRTNLKWMLSGVTMIDPETTWIGVDVELEPDTVLYPNVRLHGASHLASGVRVESGTTIIDSLIGTDAHVKANCYVISSHVGDRTALGPCAHLRPGSMIGADCKVGNFVEVKRSRFGDGVKAGHLSYIGDAQVGAGANIGAGTITCNYDGKHKHRTSIGAGVFIGSNSALVAPVTLEDEAYVAAGSVITDDVPSGALGIGRGRQRVIEGWRKKKRV